MTNTQLRAPSPSLPPSARPPASLPSSGPSAAALAGHQFSFWTRAQLLLQDVRFIFGAKRELKRSSGVANVVHTGAMGGRQVLATELQVQL